MEPLESAGCPAGGPARDLHAGQIGQPAWSPAWAGQGAGHPPEPLGLEPGLGRLGGRPACFDAF